MTLIGYVTLDEANTYVQEHYTLEDNDRIFWENLSDDSKAVYLRNSFESIERLPFAGRKTNPEQVTAFPRFPSTEIPLDIKYAQIENAVSLNAQSSSADTAFDSSFYQQMQLYGISSYSIGNLSESLSDRSTNVFVSSGIVSYKASNLLGPFLNGGYKIAR